MAGHSKWANIKHRKAAQDAKRGKVFTRLIREIVVAARLGGGDVADNPRLRAIVDKALVANMTKDTIERAIQRGAGGLEGNDVEELVYEGYGAGGVAILVETMTDNRNRTVAEVRHAFTKYAGNLGTDGSVSYLFEKKGVILFAPGVDEDSLMEIALEAGADDLETDEDQSVTIYTDTTCFGPVLDALREKGLEPDSAEITMVPTTTVACDEETAEKLIRLIDALEDLDDVQNVYHNAEFPDSVYGD